MITFVLFRVQHFTEEAAACPSPVATPLSHLLANSFSWHAVCHGEHRCLCVWRGGGGSQQLLAAQVALCEPWVVVRCSWENADGGRVAFCPYFQES